MNTSVGREVVEGSVRPCDECGAFVPFDDPDAETRICNQCWRGFVLGEGP